MMNVISCIVYSHDIRLVLLAAACPVLPVRTRNHPAGLTAQERSTAMEKAAWLLLASIVAGASIWCVHFVAMLGYHPGTPIGFDSVLTITSLIIAIFGAAIRICRSRQADGFALAAAIGWGDSLAYRNCSNALHRHDGLSRPGHRVLGKGLSGQHRSSSPLIFTAAVLAYRAWRRAIRNQFADCDPGLARAQASLACILLA
jgi:hypothetical protein